MHMDEHPPAPLRQESCLVMAAVWTGVSEPGGGAAPEVGFVLSVSGRGKTWSTETTQTAHTQTHRGRIKYSVNMERYKVRQRLLSPTWGCCLVFLLASLYCASSSCWSSMSILCCLWMSRVAPIPRGVSLVGWEPEWPQMLITRY